MPSSDPDKQFRQTVPATEQKYGAATPEQLRATADLVDHLGGVRYFEHGIRLRKLADAQSSPRPTDRWRIPAAEMECRRSFEEWCRTVGRPGKLGLPDTKWHRDAYEIWKACWEMWNP